MGRPGETEELMWFAMRVTYHRELEAKRLLDEKGVENFIPMKYEKSARTGKKRLVPVVGNYLDEHWLCGDENMEFDKVMDNLKYCYNKRLENLNNTITNLRKWN